MSKFEVYDRIGRPTLRLVAVLLLLVIGSSVAYAFFAWGVLSRPFPPIPGEAILIALATQLPGLLDQITRYLQRQQEIAVAPRSI